MIRAVRLGAVVFLVGVAFSCTNPLVQVERFGYDDPVLKELQALWRKSVERRKFELADHTRAARGARELGNDEWGGTTGAGLRDKWHLGYSNAR